MESIVKLYSNENGEIYKFLSKLFNKSKKNNISEYDNSILEWEAKYGNPVDMADIIGVFIENKEDYKINMWVSLDEDVLINVTNHNADEIIRYLYERYPH
ncbi:MAG: hypothetical protein J6M60_04260 [Clostridia bacterium]|nr:hypothetical protein [Clostridia bacterium]